MEPNNNIHDILFSRDVIKDEYGNYYEVVGMTTQGEKISELILSHAYFEIGFSRLFISELDEGYKEHDYIGRPIRDILNGHIKALKSNGREIFTVRDLLDEGIKVKFNDITKKHPREEK